MFKSLFSAIALLLASANASIFLEKMNGFFDTPTKSKFLEVAAWQIAGLFVPLMGGPFAVVGEVFWNIAQDESADIMKAYLYFFDIYTTDDMAAYFLDYAVYGLIYPMVGFETDFYEIDFAPADITCYELNGWDGDTETGGPPTYGTNTVSTAAGVTCTTAASV